MGQACDIAQNLKVQQQIDTSSGKIICLVLLNIMVGYIYFRGVNQHSYNPPGQVNSQSVWENSYFGIRIT